MDKIEHFPEYGPGFTRFMLGGPFVRHDGVTVSLFTYRTDFDLSEGRGPIELNVGTASTSYTEEEVVRLGEGNWTTGFIRIAQAGYVSDLPITGTPFPF